MLWTFLPHLWQAIPVNEDSSLVWIYCIPLQHRSFAEIYNDAANDFSLLGSFRGFSAAHKSDIKQQNNCNPTACFRAAVS